MEKTILESYERRGWRFYKKSKKEVLEIDPSLEGRIKDDLVSIYSPRSRSWTFPSEAEGYFGIQTEISEKLAWINVMKPGVLPFWKEYGYEDKEIS